jgi:3-phosphoshikimate 1-carboxyvinyltransferase
LSRISVRYRGPLRGEVSPPPDKSISHRAIILSSLSEGKSAVRNFLDAEDPMRTIEAFRQMGIEIESRVKGQGSREQTSEIIIKGKGLRGLHEPDGIIDCGNSGTTMRLMSGVLSGQPFSATLTGDAFLLKRPMQRIIRPLSEMGAEISAEEGGYPPLRITGGGLRPIRYDSPVASAQVKSAVLLAGLYCDGVTTVTEPGKSRDHTERMLIARGVDVKVSGLEVSVRGGASPAPADITIPGDLSSAAFFIVAGLIVPDSEILVRNTGINPTRSGLIDILKNMGGDLRLENQREVSGEPVADVVVKYSSLRGIAVDGRAVLESIDEFPVICIAASRAEGRTTITGAGELRVKESDRIAAMASELGKLGVAVEEREDGLSIEGRQTFGSGAVQSHGDHRVAMSLAVAGLSSESGITVSDTACINTSFPRFMEMLEGLRK